MLSIQGTPTNIKTSIIGRVLKTRKNPFSRRKSILVTETKKQSDFGYIATICKDVSSSQEASSISGLSIHDLQLLHEGDIVMIKVDGTVSVLWEGNNQNNAFLLTTACDCRCLMCPQPPEKDSFEHLEIAFETLKLIDKNYSGEICLTGGEPLLLGKRFIDFLDQCARTAPKASIILLTNGKKYADFKFAKEIAQLNLNRLMHCVSLHADVDDLHDFIVQSPGSFAQTNRGLYNLAKLYQRIEIRCVVSRLNAYRLPQIAWYIYRNFPFVDHVTFMALEMTGLALKNKEKVWIDPFDYQESLEEAVRYLHRGLLRVSVYNHPLCLVSQKTRSFARKSISSWKNVYRKECEGCREKENCCGFFETSGDVMSKHIRPIS